MLLSLLFMYGNYQAQCTNATEIIKSPTCVEQTITVGSSTTTVWLKFAPSNPNEVFRYSFSPLDGTVINDIKLHSGNNCSALTILTIYDSLNMNDSINMIGLNTNGYYFLEFTLSNRKDPINLTFCKSEKTAYDFWYYNFFINTPTGPSTLVDCLAGVWPDSFMSPINDEFRGVYDCDTADVCINDTLFLQVINQNNFPGDIDFDAWFVNANGTSLTVVNDSLAYFVFSQTGTVQFYCVPDTIASSGYAQMVENYPQEFLLNLNVVSSPPTTQGHWITDSIICANETATFDYSSFGYISLLQIDGVTVPISTNSFTVSGANYSVGTHNVVYTVNSVCGSTTFNTSFTVIDDLSSFVVDNCGNATLTFTTCSPITTPPNQSYTINWGDGSVENGTYSGNGYTVTHHFNPGNYTTNFVNSYLPGGLGGIIYQDTFNSFAVYSNILSLSGSQYSCEITSPISILGTNSYSSIVWSTVPAGLPFTGQGTTSINPNAPAWASQNTDIIVNVTAIDLNGCVYTGTWTLLECCKQNPLPTNEYFENTYYVHTSSTGLASQFNAGTYWAPTNVAIALPTPTGTTTSTPFSSVSTISNLITTYGWTVVGGVLTVNNPVFFNNDLIIDMNIKFLNCNFFRFAPNTKIILNSGVHFQVEGSTLAPYCNEMWGGIYNQYVGSKVTILNSNIISALDGLKVVNGGDIEVRGSRFIDNFIGINLINDTDASTSLILNNYFGEISGASLLFPKNTYKSPIAGITLNSINKQIIGNNGAIAGNLGQGNLFHRVRVGVDAFESSFECYRNAFYDCKHAPGDAFIDEGDAYCGIRANHFKNGPYGKLIAGSSNTNSNVFKSCEYGISVRNNMFLYADYNWIKDIKLRGISAMNNTQKEIFIRYNKLNSGSPTTFAIYCKDHLKTAVKVLNNEVNNLGGLFGSGFFVKQNQIGVYISNTASSLLYNTEVNNNILSNNIIGVWVINTAKANVISNTIKIPFLNSVLTSYQTTYMAVRGILVQNSGNVNVWTNTVTRTGGVLTAGEFEKLNGIRIEVCPSAFVWKNTMTGLGVGFYAKGACLASKVQCNQMTLCNFGFRMNAADIGIQGSPTLSAHNRWIGSINDETEGDLINYSFSNPMKYYHQNGAVWNSSPSPTIIGLPSYWTDISLTGVSNTCGSAINTTPIEIITPTQARQADLGLLASGVQLYDSLETDMKRYLNENAYGRLKHEAGLTSLGTDDAVYQAYLASLETTEIAQLDKVSTLMASQKYDSANVEINNYDPTDAQSTLLASVQTIWNTAHLTDSSIISVSDSLYLRDVACMDPLTNGSAVYIARAILDVNLDCLQMGARNQQSQNGSENENPIVSSEVFPNPNSGEFTIQSSETIESITILELSGKEIYSSKVNENRYVNQTNLERGFYVIVVSLLNGNSETHKIIVE